MQRLSGLAHGGEGRAWTALQRIRAGVDAWTPRFARPLARPLEAAIAPAPADAPPAQFIGLGGAASVAALACALDPSLRPLAARVIARWAGTLADASTDDVYLGHPGALLAVIEIRASDPSL